jgi:hypothetical protein
MMNNLIKMIENFIIFDKIFLRPKKRSLNQTIKQSHPLEKEQHGATG